MKMDCCNFFCLPRLLLIRTDVGVGQRITDATRVAYDVVSEMELQTQLRLQLREIWASATGTVAARLWPE